MLSRFLALSVCCGKTDIYFWSFSPMGFTGNRNIEDVKKYLCAFPFPFGWLSLRKKLLISFRVLQGFVLLCFCCPFANCYCGLPKYIIQLSAQAVRDVNNLEWNLLIFFFPFELFLRFPLAYGQHSSQEGHEVYSFVSGFSLSLFLSPMLVGALLSFYLSTPESLPSAFVTVMQSFSRKSRHDFNLYWYHPLKLIWFIIFITILANNLESR